MDKKIDEQGLRTDRLKKNVIGSALLRLLDVGMDFLLVPICLAYLSQADYGIWLTIFSVVGWMNFFDLGITHGLRNKLAIALSREDFSRARSYISTSYKIVFGVSALAWTLSFVVITHLDWAIILGASAERHEEIVLVMLIVAGSFSMRLALNLLTSIFLADQKPFLRDCTVTMGRLLSLSAVMFLGYHSGMSLLAFAVIQSLSPLVILTIASLLFFNSRYKNISPRWSESRMEDVPELFSLGLSFFVLQLSSIFLLSTDNFIIAQSLSAEEVVPYTIALKYFGIFSLGFNIIKTPFWSAFTEAYDKRDIDWIKAAVTKLNYVVIIGVFLVVILALSFDTVKKYWIGTDIQVESGLIVQCALFVVLQAYTSIYTQFLNGIGKVKVSLITSLFTLIFNIPLSYVFAVVLGYGSAGVLMATNMSFILYLITRKTQYHLIVNDRATGIWAK